MVSDYLQSLSDWGMQEGLLPTACRFLQSTIETAERQHIAQFHREYPDSTHLAYQLPIERLAHGLELRIKDGDKCYVIQRSFGFDYPVKPSIPVIRVENPRALLRVVNELCTLMGPDIQPHCNPRDVSGHTEYPLLVPAWIWYAATYSDFADPEKYIRKVIYELTHPTLENLEGWTVVTPSSVQRDLSSEPEKIFARHHISSYYSEGTDVLRLALTPNEHPMPGDELPSVIFRRTGEHSVEIMTIKNLQIREIRETGARKASQLAQTDAEAAKKYVQANTHGEVSFMFWVEDPKPTLPASSYMKEIDSIVDEYDARHENVRSLTSFARGKRVAVPPPTAMSFFYACQLLQQAGIKTIHLPKQMPWQVHTDPQIDTRIADIMSRIFSTAVKRIEGIEAFDPQNGVDDYFHLRFTGPLSSTLPFLRQPLLDVSYNSCSVPNYRKLHLIS